MSVDHPGAVPPPRVSVWQWLVTLLLLAGHLLLSFLAGMWAALGSMASDGCSTSRCYDLVGLGVVVAMAAAAISFVVALGWSLARLSGGRRAWWVPLVTLAAMVALWLVGAGITVVGTG